MFSLTGTRKFTPTEWVVHFLMRFLKMVLEIKKLNWRQVGDTEQSCLLHSSTIIQRTLQLQGRSKQQPSNRTNTESVVSWQSEAWRDGGVGGLCSRFSRVKAVRPSEAAIYRRIRGLKTKPANDTQQSHSLRITTQTRFSEASVDEAGGAQRNNLCKDRGQISTSWQTSSWSGS